MFLLLLLRVVVHVPKRGKSRKEVVCRFHPNTVHHAQRARFIPFLVVSLPKLQGKVRFLRNLRSLRIHEEQYETRALGIARFVPFLVFSLPKLQGKVRSLRNSEKPVGIGFGKTVI